MHVLSRPVYDMGLVPDFSSVSIPCRHQTRGPYLAEDDCFTLTDLVFPNSAAIKILVGDAFAPNIPLDLRSVESLVIATNGAALLKSLEEGTQPMFRPLCRLSHAETAEVKRQVQELLEKGLIEPSTSP